MSSFIMSKSNLSFRENFSDKNDLSTFRWLTKIKWEITKNVTNDEILSKTFLKIIYLLITENAVVWTELNQQASKISIKRNFTQKNVDTFCDLFQVKFSAKTYEINLENYNQKLKNFYQTKNESLLSYYSRMKSLIHKMSVKKIFFVWNCFFKLYRSYDLKHYLSNFLEKSKWR